VATDSGRELRGGIEHGQEISVRSWAGCWKSNTAANLNHSEKGGAVIKGG